MRRANRTITFQPARDVREGVEAKLRQWRRRTGRRKLPPGYRTKVINDGLRRGLLKAKAKNKTMSGTRGSASLPKK